ncbi:DNA recombination protein RmuC [Cohaesibacter sp. ES.047]|uniref:DNA recombination protein RmuC n=1 Tax=Cohaesibacter sp. ES.047 TaxID=1798205 RepID=UPI000BB869C2|nr:DNA recombination protein RmuC [Cohaesibacter sp. ES.047]SNY91855.1 DNA recombination protein RmuC [Cohaesibacter sp. ES.047]
MNDIVITIGQHGLTTFEILIGAIALLGLLLVWLLISQNRQSGTREQELYEAQEQARAQRAQVEELTRLQAEMTGRMQTMAEIFSTRQSEMAQSLTNRMDGMGHRLTQTVSKSLTDGQKATGDNLRALHERLAVIDKAQGNITELSGRVVELQQILANKQTRGTFGQGRMEAIIEDALPKHAFDFQYTLSNKNRPDCVIHIPNDNAVLVIDAKFPLEGWTAVKEAHNPDEDKAARTRFRNDVKKHIKDISERYFIPGETQDTAFMFVPSESLFADLHEQFDDVVQLAHRTRVVIVSPSLLTLSIQVVQSVLKDARMREQAHIIQREVALLMEDVMRLDDRVSKLQSHFGQTQKDVDQILTSTGKIVKRGRKIEDIDVSEAELEAIAKDQARELAKKQAEEQTTPSEPETPPETGSRARARPVGIAGPEDEVSRRMASLFDGET